MSITLTADIFARCTGSRIDRATTRFAWYAKAMTAYGFDSRLRIAFLLANVGHESGGFAFPREIWNPAQVPSQARYERDSTHAWPPTPADEANGLAFRLGNSQKGDGYNFRGAGDLQITGRANMAAARDRLRARWPQLGVPDFEADPDQLAQPQWAALAACDFIDRAKANEFADAMNFDGFCDLVNRGRVTSSQGDANGFEHRLNLALIGLRVLP
jgi:putative chitinase